MDTGLRGHPPNRGQNLMHQQTFVHLPPHTWTNLSCVDGGHQKMYRGTKLPSHTWTPSCFFWGCHGNEIGLRWPQFIHKEGKDQREKCEPYIWRRICDNINKCEKTFEKVEKFICTLWIIEVSHTWTLCQPWTLDDVLYLKLRVRYHFYN